jgi:hypothetical protein
MYPIVLEIKDTTDADRSASYLELHLEIDSEGRLRTFHLYVATSSSTCIRCISLSDDTTFQSLWFLSGFP